MAWQIKAIYKTGLSRWLNVDERGFHTTSQSKAKVLTSKDEVDKTLEEVRKASPSVTFEVVELP